MEFGLNGNCRPSDGRLVRSSSSLDLLQLITVDGNDRPLQPPAGQSVAEAGTEGRVAAVAGGGGSGAPRRRSATARHQVRGETLVPGTVRPIAEAVDGEIEAGVQVRQHGRVEMDAQRQAVRAVVQQHDDVRAPAAEERHEDDEDGLHLANGLHRCHVSGFGSALQTKPKHRHFGDDSGL